jgi:hypothetical protein
MYAPLRSQLPDLFDYEQAREDWDPDHIWVELPLDRIDSAALDPFENAIVEGALSGPDGAEEDALLITEVAPDLEGAHPESIDVDLPDFYRTRVRRPGMPQRSSRVPTPDSLAVYLPFHYFSENVWGVYLTLDGTLSIARYLVTRSGGGIRPQSAWFIAKVFLFYHEAFHHGVECFATRLEVDRRVPMYRTGFQQVFERQMLADTSEEEALAVAHSMRRMEEVAKEQRLPANEIALAKELLIRWVTRMPRSYARGADLLPTNLFERRRDELAEESRSVSLAVPPGWADVWQFAPHGFRGQANIKSRVNYLVLRSSPLLRVAVPGLRYISQRVVKRQLATLAGATLVSDTGPHEKWRASNGRSLPIPRHRELSDGVVRQLIRDAGLNMSLTEFLAA